MFMVFTSKRYQYSLIFPGDLDLQMCRIVVFSIFSKVHHVEPSGNKPWLCFDPECAPLSILPSPDHPNSTAKQVCKNIISWIGGRNPTRFFSVPELS